MQQCVGGRRLQYEPATGEWDRRRPVQLSPRKRQTQRQQRGVSFPAEAACGAAARGRGGASGAREAMKETSTLNEKAG